MAVKKFKKSLQGKQFRVEVGHVDPPEVLPTKEEDGSDLVLGSPLKIECPVMGFAENTDVDFQVFEPFNLHDSPVETLSGKTQKESRIVEVDWNFDYSSKKDQITTTRFVVVARCGNLTNVSEPFEILERFETTLNDEGGDPIANAQVLVRLAGREDLKATSDEEGKVSVLVPPGEFIVELLDDED